MISDLSQPARIQSEIALWGPTGSGKTWLVQSFARRLQELTARDKDFTYALVNEAGQPIYATNPPPVGGTRRIEDHIWFFYRRPKGVTKAQILSAHAHSINVHDDRGLSTVELVERATVMSITQSPYVLLMLDPTLLPQIRIQLTGSPPDSTPTPDQQLLNTESINAPSSDAGSQAQIQTQGDYAEKVALLLQTLVEEPKEERCVAVCLTKLDLLGVKKRSPWQLIEAYFGSSMHQILESYKREIEMEAFSISAAGFADGKPNWNRQTNEVDFPDKWKPYNVEAPFFWLFDKIERRRLNSSGKMLNRALFRDDRLKHYIPYPINRE